MLLCLRDEHTRRLPGGHEPAWPLRPFSMYGRAPPALLRTLQGPLEANLAFIPEQLRRQDPLDDPTIIQSVHERPRIPSHWRGTCDPNASPPLPVRRIRYTGIPVTYLVIWYTVGYAGILGSILGGPLRQHSFSTERLQSPGASRLAQALEWPIAGGPGLHAHGCSRFAHRFLERVEAWEAGKSLAMQRPTSVALLCESSVMYMM
jgi:hypothetical protein